MGHRFQASILSETSQAAGSLAADNVNSMLCILYLHVSGLPLSSAPSLWITLTAFAHNPEKWRHVQREFDPFDIRWLSQVDA